jgi:hypothetical protein
MPFQPFQVASAIDNFINPGLKEKDREKSRREDLHQIDCSSECMQSWHDQRILAEAIQLCRSSTAGRLRCGVRDGARTSSLRQKTGTRFTRPVSGINYISVC